MKIVISGSFRKFLKEISMVAERFGAIGTHILAPQSSEASDRGQTFVRLTSDDPATPPVGLERNFMDHIRAADMLYVVNPGGYVGHSAGTEMALALLHGRPVVAAEEIRHLAEELSPAVRDLVRKSVFAVVSMADISAEGIRELETRLASFIPPKLSTTEQDLLTRTAESLLHTLA